MYTKLPNLVIGFHGCHRDTYESVIVKQQSLKASNNSYDWLGNGIYFWENNLARAKEWGERRYGNYSAVIGAVIDLGKCFNLTDSSSEEILSNSYMFLKRLCEATGTKLPENRSSSKTKDILLRDLDCAVIQAAHEIYKENVEDTYAFDSVRGVFIEGDHPYPGSALYSKTHIQICVCNPNCIKGYFCPRSASKNHRMP